MFPTPHVSSPSSVETENLKPAQTSTVLDLMIHSNISKLFVLECKIFCRLYCATEVDSNGVMVPGKWGYCGSACGYCGGFPLDERNSTRQSRTGCGYQCLFNPDKTMSGSEGYYRGLRLKKPIALMFDLLNPTNYIGSQYGQHLVKFPAKIIFMF